MSSQPQEKHSKFFDLSAEVLDEIIGHLDNLHSFRLCMLSRRVHQYLLPSYLRKCGITHSEDLSTLDALRLNADKATENAFRLARTSPLISKVRHLQCKFHFPESQLLWEFRSIYGVLTKLENVERVTLDFGNLRCSGLNARPYIKQTDEWQDAFVTILRKIMEASPSSLEIVGRVHALWFIPLTFNRVLHPDEQTLPFGLLHSLKNRFIPEWFMRRRLDKDWPPPCESAVFQRVFRDTSLSSITSLSLRSSDISSHEWALIGPYVSFPNLAELSLDLEPLGSFEAIIQFLSRHPSLTSLRLGSVEVNPSQTYVVKGVFLPNLTFLSAPIAVFFIFYGEDSSIKAISHLTKLEILLYIRTEPDWRSITSRLNLLHTRLDGASDASLHLHIRTKSWIADASPTPFQWISGLTLEVYEQRLTNEQYDALPHWLAQFPALTRLDVVHSPSSSLPDYNAERKFRDAILKPPLEYINIDYVLYY